MKRSMFVALAVLPFAQAAHGAVFLSGAPTANMSCTAGVCTPTAHDAVLNVSDLAGMLSSGDVTVKSDASAKDILVRAALSWTSASRLTLDSYRAIAVESPVVVAGPGALTLTTNDGGHTGVLSFTRRGKADFWDLASNLVVDGVSFALVSDLAGLASAVAGGSSGAYALANDVNSTTTYGASPVPTTFTGTFEGLGHRIVHLRIQETGIGAKNGLFTTIGAGGIVRDLALDRVKIYGGQSSTDGALAATSYGTVSRVTASGLIKAMYPAGFGYMGGIAGWNHGVFVDCHAAVDVHGGYNVAVGGLAGTFGDRDHPGTSLISDSSASGAVSGGNQSYVGGLVGTNVYGTVLRSSASGAVHGGNFTLAGGLVGVSIAVIDSSFATGAVSVANKSSAGGLVGKSNEDGSGFANLVRNSYATGSVTGGAHSDAGSVLGSSGSAVPSDVVNAYGTGAVTAGSGAYVGGFVGYRDRFGTFTSAYWVTDTTGVSDPSQGVGNAPDFPGVVAQTTGQLQSGLPTGFDPAIWGESAGINGGYPYLLANPPQ